eukprot:COSAG06_NODE_72_length_25897_cov_9.227382_11_plen_411_part_00
MRRPPRRGMAATAASAPPRTPTVSWSGASLLLLLLLLLLSATAADTGTAAPGEGDSFSVVTATAQTSCTVEVLGCFYDKLWGDCRYLPTPKADCSPSKGGRDIPYAPEGCFTGGQCQVNLKECKRAPSPPPCDKSEITLEKCAALCADWIPRIPGAGTTEIYAAMQATSVCFCGTPEEGEAAVVTDDENKLPFSGCDNKCPGNPAESCGSAGRNTIMRVTCGTAWGASFLLLAGLAGAVYFGGGVVVAAKSSGRPVSLHSHPHFERWRDLHGLCMDGVEYSRSRGNGRSTDRGGGGGGSGGGGGGSSRAGLLSEDAASSGGGGDFSSAGGSPGKRQKDKDKESKRKHSKSSGKREKNEVKTSERQKQKEKRSSSTEPAAVAAAASTAAPTVTEAKSAASGGGGRWVHVPT